MSIFPKALLRLSTVGFAFLMAPLATAAAETEPSYLSLSPAEQTLAQHLSSQSDPPLITPLPILPPIIQDIWNQFLLRSNAITSDEYNAILNEIGAEYRRAMAYYLKVSEKCTPRSVTNSSWVEPLKKRFGKEFLLTNRAAVRDILGYLHLNADANCTRTAEDTVLASEARYHSATAKFLSDFQTFMRAAPEETRANAAAFATDLNAFVGIQIKSSLARLLNVRNWSFRRQSKKIETLPKDLVETLASVPELQVPFDIASATATLDKL